MPRVILTRAWRSWQHARGVALLAAAALAVGIGAATAIYSVVNAVMLKPLPLPEGERFIALFEGNLNEPKRIGTLQRRDVEIFQQRSHSFDLFGWYRGSGQNLVFGGEAHHVEGVRLIPTFAHSLGVDPALGRWFTDETGVVLSHGLWRRLGSDPAIIGKPITLDARPYTVAGVMPAYFRFPVKDVGPAGARPDVWLPLDVQEGASYFVYARRKPGVTFAAAQDDLRRVAAEIAAEAPATHPHFTAAVWDLRRTLTEEIRPTLLLLFGAAGLLFLITCANAAGLLLTRAVARARETATRVALGAPRWQLAAQFFVEGLLVALLGAAAGVLLAVTLTRAIVAMAADYLPRADEVTVDWTVLLFAAVAATVASALSCLAPLWQAMRTSPADALGEGVRASASAKSRRVSRWLVIAEMAFAFGLLTVSAMLLLHLRQLTRAAPGFEPANVITFIVSVPGTIAQRDDTRLPYQQRLLEALRSIPGVEHVAFTTSIPLDGCCASVTIFPEGRSLDPNLSRRMELMAVYPTYFQTMRIPLRSGRLLTEQDVGRGVFPAVVSLATAQQYWGAEDPVGAFGRFNSPDGRARFQVVGVVGDVKNDGLGKPSVPAIYIPSATQSIETMHFVVRSSRAAGSLAPEIRGAIRGVNPEQPVYGIQSMDTVIAASTTLERVASLMTAFFAGAALLLATLGVYGVVAYSVRQRTVEIGTRMALGATGRQVLALVIGDGLLLAAIAVVVGAIVTLVSAGYVRTALEIGNSGAAPFLYSAAIVAAVAIVASSLPASRAAMLSPMVAIRNDPASMWQAAQSRVRRLLADDGDERGAAPMAAVVGDFADAVRRAESFPEAVRIALAALRERAGTDLILLLQRDGDRYASGELSVPANGVMLSRLRRYSHPLAFSAGDWDTWARWARDVRPQHLEEIERLAGTGIRLAVPLNIKNDVVGVLLFGRPQGRDSYSLAERRILDSAADVLALMMENARLNARALEQEKLRRDLELAAEVQRRLLPRRPPRTAIGTLAAYTLPARSVGGDYYDFIDLPGDEMGIAIADVSGKGIAAALLMSVVQASLRLMSADTNDSCAQLAAKMNRFLYGSTAGNKYATFFYAQVDPKTRTLRFVNAGHNPPFLVRRTSSGAEAHQLKAGGTVLGLFPETDYEAGEVPLCAGDVLIAFTDGVPEALNVEGEEFGEARLETLLVDAMGCSAETISDRLTTAMRDWIADAEQHDDLTFIVLAVSDQPAAV